MQESMYSGLFGALTNEHRMANIANNLANVNTTGYKRDTVSFEDTMKFYAHDMIMEPMMSVRSEKLFPEPMHFSRPRIGKMSTDFSQGAIAYTGNPLDLAIAGDGFFKVEGPKGEMLTRNGHFVQNAEGVLVNASGHALLGAGGPITIPPTGDIQISLDGRVFVNGGEIDQIQVVAIEDSSTLEKFGQNLYRGRNGQDLDEIAPQGIMISQGYLEKANVEVVTEMVNMIEAQRQFEAYQKVMQSSDAVDKEAISKVGKAR